LIWKRARVSGFAFAAQSHAVKVAAWATMLPLLATGTVKPIFINAELLAFFSQSKEAAA
jgi:hypothetical protein